MTGTVLERGEGYLSGEYLVGGSVLTTVNRVDNVFERLDSSTRWGMVSEFRFSGMERFVMPLMKPMFAKRIRDDMRRFKDSVEG